MTLIFWLACAPGAVVLDDTGVVDLTVHSETGTDSAEADTAVDSGDTADTAEDTAEDTGTPADTGTNAPCAFIDNWQNTVKLPPEQLYSYNVTGCGVLAFGGLICDDDTIASGTFSTYDLNSDATVTLFINAWYYGTTNCVAVLEDYAYPDVRVTQQVTITVQ